MQACYYVFIDDSNPELHHEFDEEGMQEFLIRQTGGEGVLYHTEMKKIKIIYNAHDGEVKLVDVEEKENINFDYSNAFQSQRKQVELAIRRLVKLELLADLHQMNDQGICEMIKFNHDIDSATGKICSNTSEISLNMTLVKVVNLGYVEASKIFSLRRWFSLLARSNQTPMQRALYSAFEDFKRTCERGSQVLDQFRSRNSVNQFKSMLKKYL